MDLAYELSLQEGLHFERRIFHQLFATVSPTLILTMASNLVP